MRKVSSGRKYYYKPTGILLGTSIVPIYGSNLYHQRLIENQKAVDSYVQRKKENKDVQKQIVELRVEYIEFEHKKGDNITKSLNKHRQRVEEAIEKYNSDFGNKVTKIHNVKRSSRITAFGN